MKFWLLSLLIIPLAACAEDKTQVDEADGLNRAEVEQIVADYIAANGGAITDAIDTFLREQQIAQAAGVIQDYNLSMGPADAPITLVEFGNYRCPFCHRVQPTIEQLRAGYGDQVRHIFKHMPIDQTSFDAALALQAATDLGKGEEFFMAMWEHSQGVELNDELFIKMAEEVELELAAFNERRASDEVRGRVEQDIADARTAGGSGTPYFLINGEGVSGALPYQNFAARFDAILAE